MPKLTDSDFKYFESLNTTSERGLIFDLGVALQYEYAPPGIRFSAAYPQIGRQLWNAIRKELYNVICDETTQSPKEWINDLITGDIRNLATGIVSAITAKYDVTIAIAVPVAALIIKTGILNYCTEPIRTSKKTVDKILSEKRSAMLELEKELMPKRKKKAAKKRANKK